MCVCCVLVLYQFGGSAKAGVVAHVDNGVVVVVEEEEEEERKRDPPSLSSSEFGTPPS